MWDPRLADIDIASALAGVTVLGSLISQRWFNRQNEIPSEILCWAIIHIFSRTKAWQNISSRTSFSYSGIQKTSWRTSWFVAICLSAVSVYKAEFGVVKFQPIVTPLLLVVQRWLQSEVRISKATASFRSNPTHIWSATFCALITTLSLWNSDPLGLAISIIAVVPQLFAYATFLPKNAPTSPQLPRGDGFDDGLDRLCWSTMAFLTISLGAQTMMYGFASVQLTHVLVTGVSKAMTWLFVFRMRHYVCAAPAIEAFGIIAAIDPYTQSSGFQAVYNVLASIAALAQVIHMLPKQAKARMGLWVFAFAALLPYFANLRAIMASQSWAQQSFNDYSKHLVETLIDDAQVGFKNLLQTQSKTYADACDEYQRRYNMEPPPGFENWYNFAASHDSPLIDDFDTIYRSISPFWKMSGAEVLEMMESAQSRADSELWSCTLSSAEIGVHCAHPGRTNDRHIGLLFNRLLGNVSAELPDITFLVNHLDEPRVLIPPRSSASHGQFDMSNMSRQPIWGALTKYCPPTSTNASKPEFAEQKLGLPFVTHTPSAMDLCQHHEYQSMHGLLSSPQSFRLIESPVPILSTGTLSTMGDILFPSPAYIESEFQYDASHDLDWPHKRNNLYWAGSTTGGHASKHDWHDFHRQRFVSLAQNLALKPHIYLREIRGATHRVTSHFLNARLFDVAFTRIFQCSPPQCHAQTSYFRTKPWVNSHKALHSRLAFDMDGNGISGRYYQLLASRSVPLKQTLLREWHDDRLVPWAHYVPVSLGMEELPELVAWLAYSEVGQRKAREIAERGRMWHARALREVDMSVYVYRLVLELARVQDPERRAR